MLNLKVEKIEMYPDFLIKSKFDEILRNLKA